MRWQRSRHFPVITSAPPSDPSRSLRSFAVIPFNIPFDQLGAEAQKQYSGNGIAITTTADGATLRAAFQKLEGQATREGLWLTSSAEATGKPERFLELATAVGCAM